jgi:ribonuclease R
MARPKRSKSSSAKSGKPSGNKAKSPHATKSAPAGRHAKSAVAPAPKPRRPSARHEDPPEHQPAVPVKVENKPSKPRDPYFEREARKYERPIPSREYILEFLKRHRTPVNAERLAELIGLHDADDAESLRRRLLAMERDGQVVRNRRSDYVLVDERDLVRGRVIGHPDGFGFLTLDEGGDDVFLSPHEMSSLLHGDHAVVRISGIDRRGRREGKLVEVLERANKQIVGRYYEERGIGYIVPDNKRLHQDVLIESGRNMGARVGNMVVVDIVEQPAHRRSPIGVVAEVLGDELDPGMDTQVAVRSHGLPYTWPLEVDAEVAPLTEVVSEEAKQGRVDLTQLPLVTIDGEDARDFDDAVYCARTKTGWRLVVAIADVSHYVKPTTALDREAKERGTSVYFPGSVIPMLPEILSNGLCSLKPQVDRLCLACDLLLDDDGAIKRMKFVEAVMHSHARLTYTQVGNILIDNDVTLRSKYASLVPHLEALHQLYAVLRGARERRGAIDLDTVETKIVFDERGAIQAIKPLVRNDAHRLIEECMITANIAAARYLLKHKVPALYRVHEGVKTDKLDDLRVFLAELGLILPDREKIRPMDYAQLLAKVGNRPDRSLIQTVLLRSLKQAEYLAENQGHFGLSLEAYAHFTSPIRRYPDLLVHRAIRHVIRGGTRTDYVYSTSDMTAFGEHCSMTERRADEASRDVLATLKCRFMEDKVEQVFAGLVVGVTSFGLFVELSDVYVEGLVHITALGDDYYHYDAVGHRLVGERTKQQYRLADRIEVRVMRVNSDDQRIDLELVKQQKGANVKRVTKKR